MSANVLNHPSMPVACQCMTVAADNLPPNELPTLLHQSLLMWEQVFARQGSRLRELATLDTARPPDSTPGHI